MNQDWKSPVPAGYGVKNRAFLQAFMARGSMTFPEAQRVLAAIKTADEEREEEPVDPQSIIMEEFTNLVRIAREAVEPLDYDIRVMRHQVRNGERVWVFINAHSDIPTQLATTHTADEVAYIKRLLDAIFDDYNTVRMEVMAVDEGQALKLSRPARSRESGANGESASSEKGLKHSEVLALLSSLVAEGWLEKSRNGFYSLSPRSLVELWGWLVETYNDQEDNWQNIKFCESCKEIVTYGQRCAERDCMVRLHDICQDGYWRTQRAKKCPKCETPWDGKQFVGERAITLRSAFQKAKGGRRSGGGRRSEIQEPADDDEMEG